MAEEAIPAEEEWDGVGDNPFGPVPSPEEVREARQRLPRPSKPVNYNTAEAEFWRLRYIPAGSVIQFKDPVAVLDAPADVGVLVLSTLSQPGGVWVTAKFLGASTEASKERLQSYFRKRAARIHICALDKEGVCHEDSSEGFHLSEFTWYPPGDFKADWLSRYATKQVSGGPKLCLEEEKVAERESEEKEEEGPRRRCSERRSVRGRGETETVATLGTSGEVCWRQGAVQYTQKGRYRTGVCYCWSWRPCGTLRLAGAKARQEGRGQEGGDRDRVRERREAAEGEKPGKDPGDCCSFPSSIKPQKEAEEEEEEVTQQVSSTTAARREGAARARSQTAANQRRRQAAASP